MNMKSKGGLNQWTASRRRSLEGLKSREHEDAKAVWDPRPPSGLDCLTTDNSLTILATHAEDVLDSLGVVAGEERKRSRSSRDTMVDEDR